MQSFLFLKPAEDATIDRIINLDLMAAAYRNPDPAAEGGTVIIAGSAQINISLKFELFLAQVQGLVAENYKYSHEYSIQRDKIRMDEMERIMKNMMHEHD